MIQVNEILSHLGHCGSNKVEFPLSHARGKPPKKSPLPLALSAALALGLAGCSETDSTDVAESAPEEPSEAAMTTPPVETNPFFTDSPLYMYYPQFDAIENSHYLPAFERGMKEQLAEIEAITSNAEAPTLDNTLVAMERSGQTLNRVARVFFAMASAHTIDGLEEIGSEMAPKLSAHRDQILLNDKLFARVQAVYEQRDSLELDPESYRLNEENYKDFIRAGAQLSAGDKEKLKAMNAELASLQTKFSQNVLNEVNASAVVVDSREELAGMSDTKIDAAAKATRDKEMEGKYLIALLNTSQQPPLASLEDRALRQRIMEASLALGSHGGEFDNREILTRVAKIRAERAQLMGYENHAAYGLENQTARTPEAVNNMLARLVRQRLRIQNVKLQTCKPLSTPKAVILSWPPGTGTSTQKKSVNNAMTLTLPSYGLTSNSTMSCRKACSTRLKRSLALHSRNAMTCLYTRKMCVFSRYSKLMAQHWPCLSWTRSPGRPNAVAPG